MARTGKAGSLVILQPKPSITCKGCIPFLCEKQNEKNVTSQQSDILYLSCENRWHDMFWGQVWIYLNAKQFWQPCQWCTEAMGLDKRNDT